MDVMKKKEHVSRAERERGSGKSGERERSGEWEAVERERRVGVTKVGLSGEREIGRSRCTHMLCL